MRLTLSRCRCVHAWGVVPRVNRATFQKRPSQVCFTFLSVSRHFLHFRFCYCNGDMIKYALTELGRARDSFLETPDNFQRPKTILGAQYSPLLFNKLSLCPYMVRKPSISVILHDRYPAIYVNDHIWKCTADFLSLLVWRPFCKARQF